MRKAKEMFDFDSVKLSHAFEDACSNPDFLNFIRSLNIKDEILMRYTSQLEDAFLEKCHCEKCKGLSSCENQMKGYLYTPICDGSVIQFSYDACFKNIKKMKEDAYKDHLDLYDMPKDIKDASFQNIYKDDKARIPIIKYFKEFMDHYDDLEKPKGLYLNGSFGSGKTYLIAALFHEMAKKGVNSILIYYPEFLRSLKSSFSTDYAERFSHIQKVPLLLFDDIGAENCSNWSRDEVLGPILQYRMENHLPTFFTSNLSLGELEKALAITSSGVDKVKARRIIERIKQLTVSLELVSKNRRD